MIVLAGLSFAVVALGGSLVVSDRSRRRLVRPAVADALPRSGDVVSDLPDLIDAIALGVDVGLSVRGAIDVALVDRHNAAGIALAAALDAAPDARLVDVLDDFAKEWFEARIFVGAMTSALQLGTPVAQALHRVEADLRAMRQRVIETRARQLPVRLMFPLVLLILPAFMLVAVVPVIAAAFGS